jgi:hypothetical protein
MAVARALPTRNADSSSTVASPSRSDAYLGAVVQSMLSGGAYGLADEGSYFTACNATLATGIAGHAAPVVADTDTKALLHVFNGSTGKNLQMDRLFLEVTNAGTAGTISYVVVYIDQKNATALTSGGTTITPVNVLSSGAAVDTGVIVTFGACATTMSSSRKVGQQILREVIPVVQDTVMLKFGAAPGQFHSAITTAGTATNHLVANLGPVVIAPGGNLNIAIISPSQSGARSYQFDAGFWLR